MALKPLSFQRSFGWNPGFKYMGPGQHNAGMTGKNNSGMTVI